MLLGRPSTGLACGVRGGAFGAQAINFNGVLYLGEAIGLGNRGGPTLHFGGLNFHRFPTFSAQQVVVVASDGGLNQPWSGRR